MNAKDTVTQNPNATVAGGTTGFVIFVVWLAGYLGLDLTAEMGAFAGGGLATLVLAIGRDGIRGVIRRLWSGKS